jgi:hypothetical protein
MERGALEIINMYCHRLGTMESAMVYCPSLAIGFVLLHDVL